MWGEGETNMVTSEQKARRKSLYVRVMSRLDIPPWSRISFSFSHFFSLSQCFLGMKPKMPTRNGPYLKDRTKRLHTKANLNRTRDSPESLFAHSDQTN